MTDETDIPNARQNLYKKLWNEVLVRTKKPFHHPSFIVFFLLAIVGFSALGVWLELYVYIYPDPAATTQHSADALRTSILTFFPAAAGTAAMQLIWAEQPKHFRSAAFLILAIFLVVALWLFPSRISNASALSCGTLASIVALWIWWIANAKQTDLLDVLDASAPIGGPRTDVPLRGDLNDFIH